MGHRYSIKKKDLDSHFVLEHKDLFSVGFKEDFNQREKNRRQHKISTSNHAYAEGFEKVNNMTLEQLTEKTPEAILEDLNQQTKGKYWGPKGRACLEKILERKGALMYQMKQKIPYPPDELLMWEPQTPDELMAKQVFLHSIRAELHIKDRISWLCGPRSVHKTVILQQMKAILNGWRLTKDSKFDDIPVNPPDFAYCDEVSNMKRPLTWYLNLTDPELELRKKGGSCPVIKTDFPYIFFDNLPPDERFPEIREVVAWQKMQKSIKAKWETENKNKTKKENKQQRGINIK